MTEKTKREARRTGTGVPVTYTVVDEALGWESRGVAETVETVEPPTDLADAVRLTDQQLQDLPDHVEALARLSMRERRFARVYGRLRAPNARPIQLGPVADADQVAFPTTSRGLTYRVPMTPGSPGFEEWQRRAEERRRVAFGEAMRSATESLRKAIEPMKVLIETLHQAGFPVVTHEELPVGRVPGRVPVSDVTDDVTDDSGRESRDAASRPARPSDSDFPPADRSSKRESGRDNGAPSPLGEARFTRAPGPVSHTVGPNDTAEV